MQNIGWVTLLRHFPVQVQPTLMLTTKGGAEIAIQGLVRIDREFVAIQGRLAASQEAGRVFFIAYDQIDYLGFQKEMKEEEFQEMFKGLVMPDSVSPSSQSGADSKASAAAAVAAVAAAMAAASGGSVVPIAPVVEPLPPPSKQPAPRSEAPASPAAGSGNANPIKSVVLERFRSRNVGSGLRPKLPSSGERPATNG